VASLQPQLTQSNLLIQQPEPSGSEDGESRVRNKGPEIWPTKHLSCSVGFFTCRKSMTWDRRLYFPSEGLLSPTKFHRPRPERNPQQRVPWVVQPNRKHSKRMSYSKMLQNLNIWKGMCQIKLMSQKLITVELCKCLLPFSRE
jgi:hypothetical protein